MIVAENMQKVKDKKAFFITTPIYYVNDRPHIGSAYSTLLADVLARQKRKEGFRVHFSTGTDEHGVKVAQAAAKAGKDICAFTDEYASYFKETWQQLHISFDDFIRTTERRHQKAVEHFLSLLYASGHLYEGIYKGLYCVGCETFLEESELAKGLCPAHGTKPELVEEKNWFFRLGAFKEKLKSIIESGKMDIAPEGKKRETLNLLEIWSSDISISRQKVSWGIPLPFDKSQTTYVWVDALINYLTTIGYPDEKYKEFWPVAFHIIGKDILKHHAVIWPALLLAVGITPPKKIFAHSFMTIEGKKMSKSLRNVITPQDLVKEFGVDGARYVLLAEMAGDKDSDLSPEKFRARYNADLKHNVGNIFSRLIVLAQKNGFTELRSTNHELRIENYQRAFQEHLEKVQIAEAIKNARQILEEINLYLDQKKPWKERDSEKKKKILQESFSAFIHAIDLLEPVIPETAKQVLQIKKDDAIVVPKENIHLF